MHAAPGVGNVRVLALDAGGTMTDSFLLDGTGTFVVGKAQSNPHDEASAVMESVGDALGYWQTSAEAALPSLTSAVFSGTAMLDRLDRKSTRLNSSHVEIS